jgi:hypothetical protein
LKDRFNDFIKIGFKTSRKHMSSQGHSTT